MLWIKPSGLSASILVFFTCNILLISHDKLAFAEGEGNKLDTEDFEDLGLHYGKYLKEVVAALDKDQKFTDTIKNMDAEDIKSGKVAEQLKHVHEDVRKKLNDLKYLEIKRLRDMAVINNERAEFGETYHGTDKRKWRTLGASLSSLPEHLGSHNNFFDTHDLHKLMVAATNDLEKLDKDRREDFKTYEMEKEWQFQERLKMMNETEKAEAIKLRNELKEKHDNHSKVHEPGTKSQFEEVWEKSDHLPAKEFDPKTFFALHDTNSDNYWDPQEVRQLLVIEINKLYDANNPEDDPNEMEEEFERMREHVYKEIDQDKDGLISFKEFIDYSKNPHFRQDNGWQDASKKPAYTQEEYDRYQAKERADRLKNMHGYYDPSFYANQPQNLHLPHHAMGMPAGVNPAQYYGYHPVDPHAQQLLAQQQQMAYQQAAYHQQAAAGSAYQQPAQQYHPAQLGQQPSYQQAPIQNSQYQQHPPAVPQQVGYQQQTQQQQAVPPVNQQQNIPQAVPQQQQQQAIPQQQQQQQQQQVPQVNQQQNIPQAVSQQQQHQQHQQQAIPQHQQQQQPPVQQAAYQQVPQQQQNQQVPPR